MEVQVMAFGAKLPVTVSGSTTSWVTLGKGLNLFPHVYSVGEEETFLCPSSFFQLALIKSTRDISERK